MPAENDAAADEDEVLSEEEEEEESESETAQGGEPARKRRRAGASKDEQLSIPREVVRQIVRQMVADLRKDTRVDRNGMRALHVAAEAYATDIFSTTEQLVQLSDRTTVSPAFFNAATVMHRRICLAAARS